MSKPLKETSLYRKMFKHCKQSLKNFVQNC